MLTEYDIPRTLEEANERKRVIIAQVQDIETQLGDNSKKKSMGAEEFTIWRQKAKWARNNRLQELRLVKKWIEQNRDRVQTP